MAAHYGYFIGTIGADGDGVDVFIGPYPESQLIWVINQSFGAKFDEHKVMFGFPDADSARAAYANSYTRDWAGFGSMVAMSLSDFKQWLGTSPQTPAVEKSVDKVLWDGDMPRAQTFDAVLYQIRRRDTDGLVFDAVTEGELLQDADEVMTLDAMTSPYQQLPRRIALLQNMMNKVLGLEVTGFTITKAYRVRGIINIAAIFSLSDGQTITVYFHTGGSNVKVLSTDELISWKWALNKLDVTIAAAPERGVELNLRTVARRIMQLAIKNSSTFAKANAKKSETLANIDQLKSQIAAADLELGDLQSQIAGKQAERQAAQEIEAAKVAANKLDPAEAAQLSTMGFAEEVVAGITPYATYAAFAADPVNHDAAVAITRQRALAVRNALRGRGWVGEISAPLTRARNNAIYGVFVNPLVDMTNFSLTLNILNEMSESIVGSAPNDMRLSAEALAIQLDDMLAPEAVADEVQPIAAEIPAAVTTPVVADVTEVPIEAGQASVAEPVAVAIAPEPVIAEPRAESSPVESLLTLDLSFLQSIANGSIDMWTDGLAARIESIMLEHPDNAEVQASASRAITAYSSAMLEGARVAMDAVQQVPDPLHDTPPAGERANDLNVQDQAQKDAAALAVRQQNGADYPTAPTSIPVPERSALDGALVEEGNPTGVLTSPKEPVTPEQAAGATGGVPVPGIDTSGELAKVPGAPDMPSIDKPVIEGAPALDNAVAEVAQIEPTESSTATGTLIQIQENGQSQPILAAAKAEAGAEMLATEPNLPIEVVGVEQPPELKPVPEGKPAPETPAVHEADPLPVVGDTSNPLDASPMDVPTVAAPPPAAAEPTTEQVPDPLHDTPPPAEQAAVDIPLDPAQVQAEKPTEVVRREADQAYLDSVIDGSDKGEAGRLGALFENYVRDDEISGKWREAVAAFTERMRS
jgi:hypothetical protein